MSSYTIIADVSQALLGALKRSMVPDIIVNADEIVFSGPGERGDASLCLYLYDIREIRENQLSGRGGMINEGLNRQKYPSLYLELFYATIAFSSGDIKYRGINETKILGRTLQAMKDYPALNRQTLAPSEGKERDDLRIELLQLSAEDKSKILGAQGNSQKAALFYRVYPVELESLKTRKVKRVRELELTFGKKD